jgi:hypothetical protein
LLWRNLSPSSAGSRIKPNASRQAEDSAVCILSLDYTEPCARRWNPPTAVIIGRQQALLVTYYHWTTRNSVPEVGTLHSHSCDNIQSDVLIHVLLVFRNLYESYDASTHGIFRCERQSEPAGSVTDGEPLDQLRNL